MADQTPRQVRDELKASYQQTRDAKAAAKATAAAEKAAEAAALVYIHGLDKHPGAPKAPVDYPEAPADKKAKLGAILDLAYQDKSVREYLPRNRFGYEVSQKAMEEALSGEYAIKGRDAKDHRAAMQRGLKQSRENNIAQFERSQDLKWLSVRADRYLNDGEPPETAGEYTDAQLGAIGEMIIDDPGYIGSKGVDGRRLHQIMNDHFRITGG